MCLYYGIFDICDLGEYVIELGPKDSNVTKNPFILNKSNILFSIKLKTKNKKNSPMPIFFIKFPLL